MPTYEYECEYCGERKELARFIARRDDPLTHRHEEAGQVIHAPMHRVVSAPALKFTGPGVTRGSSGFGKTQPKEATPSPPEHKGESSTP